MVRDLSADDVVTCLKRCSERKGGISGIDVKPAALALVKDLDGHPHAFVLACIADRQTRGDIAWNLPHAIREAAGDFEFDTLKQLPKSKWAEVLASSGHWLGNDMGRLLPEAIRHIGDRYDGNASRIWASGSSGVAVARRFLAFDGVGPKIANMAANILIRDFDVPLANPMPDIAADTHVQRVFERLGLLGRLRHREKQQHRLQLRARELNPDWPGELDWPAWFVGRTWCHARRAPNCDQCDMRSVCPQDGVTSNPTNGS